MARTILIYVLLIAFFLILASAAVLSFTGFGLFTAPERHSPSDWITEDQISVYSDKVILNVLNPIWAKFTNTNSMDPFIDELANAIEIKPRSAEQIQIGDVISYQTSYGTVIHRVVQKNADTQGVYYIVQGDNNTLQDPVKVRFAEVEGVVIAVIY